LGELSYGTQTSAEFDDRVLAHLQAVIGAKLRRREPFYLTWANAADGGRSTIWLDSSVPLSFVYGSSRMPSLNRKWLEVLTASANTPGGLHIVPEPEEQPIPPLTSSPAAAQKNPARKSGTAAANIHSS
jgi:hypothetical protein